MVIAAWAVVLAVGVVVGGGLFDRLSTVEALSPGRGGLIGADNTSTVLTVQTSD
jgi:hypothetical protein